MNKKDKAKEYASKRYGCNKSKYQMAKAQACAVGYMAVGTMSAYHTTTRQSILSEQQTIGMKYKNKFEDIKIIFIFASENIQLPLLTDKIYR